MRPTEPNLVRLADILDDRNPAVRILARKKLVAFADQERWGPIVLRESRRALDMTSWRATEQAVHLIVHMDDKESEGRLVELLDHERAEPYVTAAWGLATMAPTKHVVEGFAFAERCYEMAQPGDSEARELQLAHLLQWLGVVKHKPAEPLMRKFIPKSFQLIWARCAAIWALGHLYEGNPNDELVSLFIERVNDVQSSPPELNPIRAYAVISMGRMQLEDQRDFFVHWLDTESVASPVGAACAWALFVTEGEPIPKFELPPAVRSRFFLERLKE